VEDVRIERHNTYLADQGVDVCRIHYNYPDESARPGLFYQYGVKGFRINRFSFQGKTRTLYFMGYCLRRRILADCRKALEALDIDPAQPSILHATTPSSCHMPHAGQKFLPNSRVVYYRHEATMSVHFAGSPYRSFTKASQKSGSPELSSFRSTTLMRSADCFRSQVL
jgi:hypothetical protein